MNKIVHEVAFAKTTFIICYFYTSILQRLVTNSKCIELIVIVLQT